MKTNTVKKKKKILFDQVFGIAEENESNTSSQEDENNKNNVSNEDNNIIVISDINNNSNINNSNQAPKETNQNVRNSIIKKDIYVSIYNGSKKTRIKFGTNRKLEELIDHLVSTENLRKDDKDKNNYHILYGRAQLQVNDNRKIKKIIEDNNASQKEPITEDIKVIIKNKSKDFVRNREINKMSVILENIPSFMDLSDQINNFMARQKNEDIKYDIIYKNNCCNIIFVSSEIAFSFVAYMTNLKFRNKYYRKLRIDIKYNNSPRDEKFFLPKISLSPNNSNSYMVLNTTPNIVNKNKTVTINTDTTININKNNNNNANNNTTIMNNNSTLIKTKDTINSESTILNTNKKGYKITHMKSYSLKSGGVKYNNIDDYFNDKLVSIRESTPYGQEKLISRLERDKSKKKWITKKGFFTGANKKSFNRYINPNSLSPINNLRKPLVIKINKI